MMRDVPFSLFPPASGAALRLPLATPPAAKRPAASCSLPPSRLFATPLLLRLRPSFSPPAALLRHARCFVTMFYKKVAATMIRPRQQRCRNFILRACRVVMLFSVTTLRRSAARRATLRMQAVAARRRHALPRRRHERRCVRGECCRHAVR